MRLAAGLLAGVGAASLLVQWAVPVPLLGLMGSTALFLGFYTILTFLVVTALLGALAAGRRVGPRALGWAALQAVMIGLIYHLLLADAWSPQGLMWWADQGLHVVLPVGMALFWWRYVPHGRLARRDALIWLGWPAGFAVYALARGAATGWYPYWFLDVASLGWRSVGLAVLLLGIAFLLGGLLMVAIDRALARSGEKMRGQRPR
ncbi:MAG: Pr6Pr family membrane protein [Rhodovarius sp.]|nr:Pr6Pr family membrane protein [Rhodovarius sp.]